jgi:hypothetical protein
MGVLEGVSLVVLLFFGAAIVAGAVAGALYVPTQIGAVLICAPGCILGTTVFCLTLPKVAVLGPIDEATKLAVAKAQAEDKASQADARAQQAEQRANDAEAKAADRAKEMQAKLRQAEAEAAQRIREAERRRAALELEVERQQRMRIDVNSYRPVLKLGLLEMEAAVTDFYQKVLDETKGGTLSRDEQIEYVGVLAYKFTACLGVDLTKVRFHAKGPGVVLVFGIEGESQGIKNMDEQWPLKEIRLHKTGGPRGEDHVILCGDGRATDLTIEQRRTVQQRINEGLALKSLDAAVRGMARAFIKALLAPLGKEIVFDETPGQPGVGLIEFLECHNQAIDAKIKELKDQERALVAQ